MDELEEKIRDTLNREQNDVNVPQRLRTRVERGALGVGVLRALLLFYLFAFVGVFKGSRRND